MIKLFDWFSEKAGAAKSFVMETVSQVSTATHHAYNYTPNIINFSSFSQFWQGFTVAANPEVVLTVAGSQKTRRVILQSLVSNAAWYIGSAFTYELSKSYWRSTMQDMENSYAEWGIDYLAAWYFALLSLRMIIDNNSYNLCIAKTVADDNPNALQTKQCACGTVAIARASIASPFYYVSNLITAKFFEKMLPFGEYLALPFLALVYGQCFTEYTLGSLCTEHRYKELAKNNAFAFGLGVSFLLANFITSLLVGHVSGINSPYIDKAIFYLVFQYYIMLSLLMEKPLPGVDMGKDIFFHGRLVMESLLKQGSDWIVAALQNPNNQMMWQPVVDFLLKFKPLQLAKKLFLFKDQQTVEAFVKSPSIELFFDLRGDDIQNGLQMLIDVRNMPLTKRLAYVTPYIPNFLLSSEIKKVINFLMKEKLDGVVESVNDFITTARLKIKIYDHKALKQIAFPEHPISEVEEKEAPVPVTNPSPDQQNTIILPVMPRDQNKTSPLVNTTIDKDQGKEILSNLIIIEDYFDQRKPSVAEKKDLMEDWEVLPGSPKGLQQNSLFAAKKKSALDKGMHSIGKKISNAFH